MPDDNIQHGIDDDPKNDGEKGAALGGVGGAVAGAVAGSAVGPLGTLAGAAIGGIAGAVASGAAVSAVDRVDNDNTVTGLGSGATRDIDHPDGKHSTATIDNPDGNIPGVQTGGHAVDGTPDTRGVIEKVSDTVTGDTTDDKTGKQVKGDTVG